MNIAVATVTWARTSDEAHLLARSIERLADAGFPVAVADRTAGGQLADALARVSGVGVTVAPGQGLVAQVKASLRQAGTLNTPHVLYVEPDKEDFFVKRLLRFTRRASSEEDAGVVLACRSAAALATFPAIQQYTEGVFNRLCGERLGAAGDYAYGPFLMQRALLPTVDQLDETLGWGWRPALFVAAHREGRRIVHLVDDHECPIHQRDEDDGERSHRIRQLGQNLRGLIG